MIVERMLTELKAKRSRDGKLSLPFKFSQSPNQVAMTVHFGKQLKIIKPMVRRTAKGKVVYEPYDSRRNYDKTPFISFGVPEEEVIFSALVTFDPNNVQRTFELIPIVINEESKAFLLETIYGGDYPLKRKAENKAKRALLGYFRDGREYNRLSIIEFLTKSKQTLKVGA